MSKIDYFLHSSLSNLCYSQAEKMSNKRRSSILKTPKCGPFGNVDLVDPYVETTLCTTTKRVSFASSNFVKPFVADPDKNTIWDTTYEEAINHTDSTQSSQEQSNKLDSTFFKAPLNVTNISTLDMDITRADLLMDKENIARMSIVDYAKKLSTSSIVPLFNISSRDTSQFSTPTMELTCQNLNPAVITTETQDCSAMELTEISVSEEVTDKLNKSQMNTMEFTCQIPPLQINTCLKKQGQTDNYYKTETEDVLSKTQRSNTCQVLSHNQKVDELSKGAMSLEGSMEFTRGNSCQNEKINAKKSFTSDMELTTTNYQNIKTFPEEKSATSNMEFTCQLPVNLMSKSQKSFSDMEFTCQIPTSQLSNSSGRNAEKSFASNKKLPKNYERIKTCPEEKSTTSNMEFTCQLPVNQMSKSQKSFTDTEFTCRNPTLQLSNASGRNAEKSFASNMEFTCQKPLLDQNELVNTQTSPAVKSSSVEKSEMEFTCQIQQNFTSCISDDTVANENNGCQTDIIENKKQSQLESPITSNHVTDGAGDGISQSCVYRSVTPSIKNSPSRNSKTLNRNPCQSPLTKMKTPEKNDFEAKEESTCTSPVKDVQSAGMLYSQEISNLKIPSSNSFSYPKTPEPSFQINLTNISSGVDDTQHLLYCTYTKGIPESLIASKLETAENKVLPLQHVDDVAKPSNLSCMELDDVPSCSNSSISEDNSFHDVIRSKLTTVNDTYVLRKIHALKNKSEQSVDDSTEDDSLGILDIEKVDVEVQSSYLEIPDVGDEDELPATSDIEIDMEFTFKKFDIPIKRVSGVKDLIEKVNKQTEQITEFLENFTLHKLQVPELLPTKEKSLPESKSAVETEDKTTEAVCLTTEESVKKRQESSQNAWKLEKVDGEFYHFSTLFGTLVFIVELHPTDRRVIGVQTRDELKDDAHPIALYIMKIFLEKLDNSHIKSALGAYYDVLSLLDYVQITMCRLIQLQEDLVTSHNLILNPNFIATYKIINVSLKLSVDVSLDVNDIENLNFDNVEILVKHGAINHTELKNLIKNCSKGFAFFKDASQCFDNYIKLRQKRKILEKSHT